MTILQSPDDDLDSGLAIRPILGGLHVSLASFVGVFKSAVYVRGRLHALSSPLSVIQEQTFECSNVLDCRDRMKVRQSHVDKVMSMYLSDHVVYYPDTRACWNCGGELREVMKERKVKTICTGRLQVGLDTVPVIFERVHVVTEELLGEERTFIGILKDSTAHPHVIIPEHFYFDVDEILEIGGRGWKFDELVDLLTDILGIERGFIQLVVSCILAKLQGKQLKVNICDCDFDVASERIQAICKLLGVHCGKPGKVTRRKIKNQNVDKGYYELLGLEGHPAHSSFQIGHDIFINHPAPADYQAFFTLDMPLLLSLKHEVLEVHPRRDVRFEGDVSNARVVLLAELLAGLERCDSVFDEHLAQAEFLHLSLTTGSTTVNAPPTPRSLVS
jgi:hypothetical protein